MLQPVRLFVASPGGVEAERAAVRMVADELNVPLRRHGWEVVVLGWEDRGPASGRAQADINADVRACDIFVGVVWTRWGTPTGGHTSGFAEEWALARERFERSGSPELWLYFKDGDGMGEVGTEQQAAVDAFRREVEGDEIAFYKTFADANELAALLRPRLLDEVLTRSGLTRTEIGGVAIDWSSTYADEPVVLVRDGRDRKALADQLAEVRPEEAARLYAALATDVEENGLADEAAALRIAACRALLTSGESAAAVDVLRRVLRDHVWWLRLDEVDHLLRALGDVLPPEFDSERRAWSACAEVAEDPRDAAYRLGEALTHRHAFPLDPATLAQWRALRWRCLLDLDEPAQVTDEAGAIGEAAPLAGAASDVELELALLRADALRADDRSEADGAWLNLRLTASDVATERPERSAWIATRMAYDLVQQEKLVEAEAAYADAASRWSATPAGQEQAARAFFSAQAAARLEDPWTFRGWGWRSLAAAQRSPAMTFARRADQLERQASDHRLAGEHGRAVPLLTCARWCYERAGLLHGALRAISLAADVEGDRGNFAEAAELHCRSADAKGAEASANTASPRERRAVADRVGHGRWPSWSIGARCAALARAGRSTSPDVADQLAPVLLRALEGSGKRFDNTPDSAAEGLAQLALAADDDVRETIVEKLAVLAADDRYSRAQAGRSGLRMLSDLGDRRFDALVIDRFIADERPDEPDPQWVASRLEDDGLRAKVREAALRGHSRALLALIESDRAQGDEPLREVCVRRTRATLGVDLGMTTDGQGMHGLLALSAVGAIAGATGDDVLIDAAAERLLVYALETRWPMGNRVSALQGLWALRTCLDATRMLTELRALAVPEEDHDEAAGQLGLVMFAQRGDLEAVALQLSASFAAAGGRSPDWLEDAIVEATLDERDTLRAAGWWARSMTDSWFDTGAARHALLDASEGVRAAALGAWKKRAGRPLPASALRRLVADDANNVRLTLIDLLAERPDLDATPALLADPDAYVRGVARQRLEG